VPPGWSDEHAPWPERVPSSAHSTARSVERPRTTGSWLDTSGGICCKTRMAAGRSAGNRHGRSRPRAATAVGAGILGSGGH
jgi:hypothetical protein